MNISHIYVYMFYCNLNYYTLYVLGKLMLIFLKKGKIKNIIMHCLSEELKTKINFILIMIS